MIARVLLLGSALLFLALLLSHHAVAARMLDLETAALARVPAAAAAGERPEAVEGGYRFRWLGGGEAAPLLVAEPVRPGADAVRVFATLDGRTVYEFDPVTSRIRDDRPEPEELRRWLLIPAPERARRPHPPGSWRPVAPGGGG